MRRSIGALAVVVAIALAVAAASAPPAHAASLAFSDPKGDATGIGPVQSTPRPSDPELDLLEVSLATTADTLTVVVRLDKVGVPQASFGSTYTMGFRYDEVDYAFRYQNPSGTSASASGLFFRQGNTSYPCGRCSAKLDAKTATLRITAPFASLSTAIRQYKRESPPMKPGSKIDNLVAGALRSMSGTSLDADYAAAKPGTTFTF